MKRALAWYLERLADPSGLCRLEPDEGRTVMDSSLNPRHGPRDCNFFLRQEEEGWNVLVDYEGAGCLTRFWTAGDFDGDLEIYFDGSNVPAIRTSTARIFLRWVGAFRQTTGARLSGFEPGTCQLSADSLRPGLQDSQRHSFVLLADQCAVIRGC